MNRFQPRDLAIVNAAVAMLDRCYSDKPNVPEDALKPYADALGCPCWLSTTKDGTRRLLVVGGYTPDSNLTIDVGRIPSEVQPTPNPTSGDVVEFEQPQRKVA